MTWDEKRQDTLYCAVQLLVVSEPVRSKKQRNVGANKAERDHKKDKAKSAVEGRRGQVGKLSWVGVGLSRGLVKGFLGPGA